jgi:hypothetical protein
LDDAIGRSGVNGLAGGHTLSCPGDFIAPTIVSNIDEDAPLVAEERLIRSCP